MPSSGAWMGELAYAAYARYNGATMTTSLFVRFFGGVLLMFAVPALLFAQELRIVGGATTPIGDPSVYRAYYGKLSGEPHVEATRIQTQTIGALDARGLDPGTILELYPDLGERNVTAAIGLERRLAENLHEAA